MCREQSVGKLAAYEDRITVIPGATNDRDVIRRAVEGCDGVLIVLVPRGVHHYASGTAQAVLDHARPDARLVFSCGWHITRDGQDVYSWKLRALVRIGGPLARFARFADLDDQVEACRRVFESNTRWTVVRGSDLEGGREPGPTGLEPARRGPHPREQHDPPRGLRPVHGRSARERQARPRGPGHRRLPNAVRASARRRRPRGGSTAVRLRIVCSRSSSAAGGSWRRVLTAHRGSPPAPPPILEDRVAAPISPGAKSQPSG